jgi:N-acetylglucosaminyldiphosphoundecaprenol N-acetyl-beta-D-mannosaminyltransferase
MAGRTTPTVRIGSTEIAALTLAQSVTTVMELASTGDGHHLVVTPNVDHLVLLERDPEFAQAYERASLRVADGAPVVALSRALGTPVPQRVTGVDLSLAALAAAASQGRSVFLFGGAPGVLGDAARRLRTRWPDLRLVGAAAPPVDLDVVTAEEERALTAVRDARPDLVLLFLGTPKQEKWFWRRAGYLPPVVALAVGGTVDLIAGTRRRAPCWLQTLGGEWLWRMALEPRRLGYRYLVQDPQFAVIAARQLRTRRRHAVAA